MERSTLAKWLKIAAQFLGYIAAAIAGGAIVQGCRNGALINLCSL